MKSSLFDETTFYPAFTYDLKNCQKELIIESPFITAERTRFLNPLFKELLEKGVQIFIFTRDPKEHNPRMEQQSEEAIRIFEIIGVQVLICLGSHHRKLAIIDRKILWEGSLNILSQSNSREIMRRMEGERFAMEMFNFLNLDRFI
ncbi:phospholipase D-like domain-containing protein [Patescibacteria group bacterium]|nr:phospholipase D-like domain-containing protein [Patescibacteria group bacterium]